MRQPRMIILAAAVIASIIGSLAVPREASALEAFVVKGKSDCNSLELAVTLTYSIDDTGGADIRDHFLLEVYDHRTRTWLTGISESILQEQSPFYWQTGRINVPASFDSPGTGDKANDGLYRIEMWDTSDKGTKQRLIDRVFLQCTTQNMWRNEPPRHTPQPQDLPSITCRSRTPFWTTNGAPEKGAVMFMYTFGQERTDLEFHLLTLQVKKHETFDMMEVQVPCGTYLRLYFQPDSTKQLYYMPSQYWPHSLYGTLNEENAVGPIYYTFFPLNGPTREHMTASPSPQPTATNTPGPTNTPTP